MLTGHLRQDDSSVTFIAGIAVLLSGVPLLWLIFSVNPLKFLSGSDFLVVHTLMEIFAVIVAALIFFIAYGSRRRLHSVRVIVLGCTFLAAALFDIFHFLSFPGMPDFVTENNANKSILFWLCGRFAVGLGLLLYISLAASWFKQMLRPERLLAATVVVVTLISCLILYAPEFFPIMFIKGYGLTTAKVGIEWLVFSIYVGAAVILYWQRDRVISCNVNSLLLALFLMAEGELFFTMYIQVNDAANLLGHVYKVIGSFYLYTAIFSEAINRPIEQIQKMLSHDELTGLASRAAFSSQLTKSIESCS